MSDFRISIQQSMKGVGAAIAGVAASLVTLAATGATEEAMKVEAAMGQLGRTMGENAKVFDQWSRESAAAFGLSRSAAVQYGATYARVVSDFTSDTNEVLGLTQRTLRAASLISASTGMEMTEVVDRIRSALNQEADGADELGVDVRVAAIQASKAFKELSNGKPWEDLATAQKKEILLMHVLNETSRRYGDTLQNNTMRHHMSFVAQLQNVKLSLGEAFLPIYNAVLPALNRMAQALATATEWLAAFSRAMFGYEAPKQTAAIDNQASSVAGLGGAMEETGKQAKKAKSALAGFDKLNLLGEKPSQDEEGGAGASTDTTPWTPTGDQMTETANRAQESAEKIKKAFQSLREALVISPAIRASFSSIGQTLTDLWDRVLKPFANYMISDFAPSVLSSFATAFGPVANRVIEDTLELLDKTLRNGTDALARVWENTFLPSLEKVKLAMIDANFQMGAAMQSLWDGTLKPLADQILNDFILPVSEKAASTLVPIFADVLVLAIEEFANTFDWAVGIINDAYQSVLKPAIEELKVIVIDVLDAINLAWEKHGQDIITQAGNAIEGIRSVLSTIWEEILKPIFEVALTALTTLWDGHLKGLVDQVADFVLKLAAAALEIHAVFILPLLEKITKAFGPVIVSVFKGIVTTLGWVLGVVADVASGLLKALGGVLDFILGVFTGDWGRAWEGVKTIFAGVFDSLVAIVKTPLNLIIDMINKVIAGLNKINNFVPGIGGEASIFDLKKIPKLAQGGLAFGPTLAMVGDNRAASLDPEVIAPLSKLKDMMGSTGGKDTTPLLQAILQTLKSNQGDLVLKVGETELARVVATAINDVTRRTGKSPIIV